MRWDALACMCFHYNGPDEKMNLPGGFAGGLMNNMARTLPPFKIAATEELMTAQSGLILFGECSLGLGLERWLDGDLPKPGSGHGFGAFQHAFPLVLMLSGGGCHPDRCREAISEVDLKCERGYMPMVGDLAEAGMVIHDEFRAGNVAQASANLDFLRACEERLPRGHCLAAIRAYSASYQAWLRPPW